MTLAPRLVALAALAGLAAPAAEAGDASAWTQGHHSRVRLVSGGPAEAGARRLAGIEIRLDPGYKTYWRSPGDAGLPPTFDWSGSRNVKAVEVAWPAPRRLEDPGGVSFGYADGVLLPLKITPERPGAPVELKVGLHYGVCKDICIPAQASLRLSLPDREGPHAPLVAAALARVPRPQALGEGALAILTASAARGGLTVTARSSGERPSLFAEGPAGWYLGAPTPAADGASFEIEVLDRPKDAAGPVPIALTLVAGEEAVETVVTLDAGQLSR